MGKPRDDSSTASYREHAAFTIAGGALAATGVVLILMAPKKMTTQAAIMPLVGLGFFGAKGSF